MNFLKLLLLFLSNESGELNLIDGDGEQSLDDLVSEVESETEESGSDEGEDYALEESGQEESQPEKELSLEEQLQEVEDSEANGNLLDLVNGLGLMRNGLPVELQDENEIKNLIQQGYDYTQKTQELSELRKQTEAELSQAREKLESERAQWESENQEIATTYPMLQATLGKIQNEMPELFQEIDEVFRQVESQMGMSNPLMEKRLKELESQIKASKETEQTKQFEEIRNGWESELTDTQKTLSPKLRTLGIKPDWSKVKQKWESDTTNSMTVKEALFAVHGEAITNALESKSKVAKHKQAAARKGLTDPDQETPEIFGMSSGNSYIREAQKIANNL